jgi:hypothetical protein
VDFQIIKIWLVSLHGTIKIVISKWVKNKQIMLN